MIDLIGKKIAVVQCANAQMVGLRGVFALETMKTITIVKQDTKETRTLPKVGTVFRVQDGGRIVVADEMVGRLEDRIVKGAKV